MPVIEIAEGCVQTKLGREWVKIKFILHTYHFQLISRKAAFITDTQDDQ